MPKVKQVVIDRVIGMLMQLWSKAADAETKAFIRETIDELNNAK